MPTMLRSRGAFGTVRASTYQYAPQFLLYREDANTSGLTRQQLVQARHQHIPAHLQKAWKLLSGGKRKFLSPAQEKECAPLTEWIATH